MSINLSPQEEVVLTLLGNGLSRDAITRRLGMSDDTFDLHRRQLLKVFEMHSTGDLRALAKGLKMPPSTHRDDIKVLNFGRRYLPNLNLSLRRPVGVMCRTRFRACSLRDVADYICDCESVPGRRPDDFNTLLTERTGTIGAKQALLAILANEAGCSHLELVVACCEMHLPATIERPAGLSKHSSPTLPLAICWLRYKQRRLQIGHSMGGSSVVVNPIMEVRTDPVKLTLERARLYKEFAADWCRALEVTPKEFARLRAAVLRAPVGQTVIENLLGLVIDSDYEPMI